MVNDFTVIETDDLGVATERKFTSHAQARQFLERMTDHPAPMPHQPVRSDQASLRRGGLFRPLETLTPEQQRLKDEAMKQFKGL